MRNSRILAINLGALNNEVVKALVLAGIGSLTVLDSSVVRSEDLGAQFFLEDEDVGKNVGVPSLLPKGRSTILTPERRGG
jgi:ubiquitin-like 1-activating enzyme E1 A